MFRMDGMASRLDVSHIRDAFPKNHGKSLAESIAFLPPLTDITCIITGCTSGIGLQIGRQLAESGAHVIMAVRKPKVAHELIQKWQNDWSGMRLPLDIEVMELDLLYLDSVVRFAEAWNARVGPLHVLINNAGIFSIGGDRPPIRQRNCLEKLQDGTNEHMRNTRSHNVFQRMGMKNICK